MSQQSCSPTKESALVFLSPPYFQASSTSHITNVTPPFKSGREGGGGGGGGDFADTVTTISVDSLKCKTVYIHAAMNININS